MKHDGRHKSCELIEPFDMDVGSSENMTPVYAFVLGLEWQICGQKLLQ
jgi:hypothetical protein